MSDGWVTAATDGACAGNPGPAGWAWVVDERCWQAGSLGSQTNNVAELEAIRRLLLAVPAGVRLRVLTDSQYALKCVTVWAPRWQRDGWRKRDGQPVGNRALVEELLGLYRVRRGAVKVEWVRGHAQHPLNEAADRLAVSMRQAAPRERMIAGPGWVL